MHRKKELFVFRTSRGRLAQRSDLLDYCQLPQAQDRYLGVFTRHDASAPGRQESRSPRPGAFPLETIASLTVRSPGLEARLSNNPCAPDDAYYPSRSNCLLPERRLRPGNRPSFVAGALSKT